MCCVEGVLKDSWHVLRGRTAGMRCVERQLACAAWLAPVIAGSLRCGPSINKSFEAAGTARAHAAPSADPRVPASAAVDQRVAAACAETRRPRARRGRSSHSAGGCHRTCRGDRDRRTCPSRTVCSRVCQVPWASPVIVVVGIVDTGYAGVPHYTCQWTLQASLRMLEMWACMYCAQVALKRITAHL